VTVVEAETRPTPRLVRLIEWYQRSMEGRPSPCRFTPSCSSYAHEALMVHGTRRGLWLTVRRLARCRPFGPSGFDPVPEAATPPSPSPSTKD
jgi:putative membrane protein insertion efficiency factor